MSTAVPTEARPSDRKHLVQATLISSGLATVAKLVGVAREMCSAAVFGANRAMDTFVVAKSVPDMFSQWVETPFRAAFVPLFTRVRHEEGEDRAWEVASNILNTLLLLLAVLVLLLYGGAGLVVRLLSAGFRSADAWSESASLARPMTVSILFSTAAVVLGSLSNIYRRQAVPGFGRVANGIAVLAGLVLLGPHLGLTGYAWGIVAGAVATFVIQLDIVWRHRRQYRIVLRPFAAENREMVRLAWPLFIGLAGTRIDILIDRNFASFLPAGSLAIASYALFVSITATELLVTVSQSVLLPHFAKLAAEGRHRDLGESLMSAIENYLFLVAPLTGLVCGGARSLVEVAFGRGRFTPADVALTALIVPILTLGDPAFGVSQLLAHAHVSGGDTKTPMRIGFVRIGYKMVAALALVPVLGLAGLVLATATSNFVRAALLWRSLRGGMRPAGARLLRAGGRFAASVILGAGAAAAVFRYQPPGASLAVRCTWIALAGVAVVVVHAVSMRLLRDARALQIEQRLRSVLG